MSDTILTETQGQILLIPLRFGSALRWMIGQTEDAREGPRAFSEKRATEYHGR